VLDAISRRLQRLCERRLDGYDVVALFLDGKTFAEDRMVIALGITLTGEKVLLGFVQTATENERVCAAFLRDLVARGLRIDQGRLCVIAGAKGLRKAIQVVFGPQALVQRCQWHKRENVVSYLPMAQQATWRRTLQAAYGQPTYPAAKAALLRCRQELRLLNASAVASLDEGLEETLTLHRLGLVEGLVLELSRTIYYKIERQGPLLGIPAGFLVGFGLGLMRTAVGAYELLTFPIALPDDYKPILSPQFPFGQGRTRISPALIERPKETTQP